MVASEQQTKITRYASLYANAAAILRFIKELGFVVKESSVWAWKYLAEIQCTREASKNDLLIKSLPSKERGQPLLLGNRWDAEGGGCHFGGLAQD